jgi:sirohydrochlorin cobaltochelatase
MNTPSSPSSTPVTALVLIGHGSRDPLWRGPIDALAARVSQRSPGLAVCCAFLEWASPDVTQAVEALVSQGHVRIRLLPLFFGMGKQAREDMPALVGALRERHPHLDLQVMPSAGEQARVIDLLAELALLEP